MHYGGNLLMRGPANPGINLDQLKQICSFIISTDSDLNIRWASPSVLNRVESAPGKNAADILKPVKPEGEISYNSVAGSLGTEFRFILRNEQGDV
ncbi:MAG: hypothetical protein GF417_09135, partial [Candidatus Latescibacteria bacterium]|nr:hypothetical protein [bacterium]MBD3424587.1 hypothetical protein [Candidatus Latescibacterota bacterium]